MPRRLLYLLRFFCLASLSRFDIFEMPRISGDDRIFSRHVEHCAGRGDAEMPQSF